MVITAPVVGKLSRQSLEQIVGTLVGGVSGYLTWMVIDAYHINRDGFLLSLCLSVCSAAVGFFNVVVEESLSDANMTALTFLSVVFGTTDSPTELLLPAITRVAGIISGVLLSLVLSVLLWPKSASEQAMRHMKAALLALDQLSALAWQQYLYEGDTALLPQDKLKASALNELQSSLSMPDPMATDPRPLLASAVDEGPGAQHAAWFRELRCEAMLMAVHDNLYKMEEYAVHSSAEAYVGTFGGHWFFLPGINCWQMGRWALPKPIMAELSLCIRQVARLLRSLHDTFAEGFDDMIQGMLQKQDPACRLVIPRLTSAAIGVLHTAVQAFPNDLEMDNGHLLTFEQAVKDLNRISDHEQAPVRSQLQRLQSRRWPIRRSSTSGFPSEDGSGSSMHRVTLPSMLSRHQLVPANSPASVHVDADATVAAQTHAAGIESPFLREQHAEPHSGTPIAIPSSGRLFPDTAKGHMAMALRPTFAIMESLPDEAIQQIFSTLTARDLLHALWTCSAWRQVLQANQDWWRAWLAHRWPHSSPQIRRSAQSQDPASPGIWQQHTLVRGLHMPWRSQPVTSLRLPPWGVGGQDGWSRRGRPPAVLVEGTWALLTCTPDREGPTGGRDRLQLVKLAVPRRESKAVWGVPKVEQHWLDFGTNRYTPYALQGGATDLHMPFIVQGRASDVVVWKANQQYPIAVLHQKHGVTVPAVAIERSPWGQQPQAEAVRLVSCSDTGKVSVWRVESLEESISQAKPFWEGLASDMCGKPGEACKVGALAMWTLSR
ncbi:hypothetical protein ABBQ32_000610 [Trebouxia sp. C0010 RCD-2024]